MTAPETRWTAETEELVAGKLPAVEIPCPDPQCGDSTWDHECELGATGPNLGATRRILAALADAGLLLLSGGTTSEDYNRYSERVGEGPWRDVHAVRNVTTWPDGAKLTGPWIEVPS